MKVYEITETQNLDEAVPVVAAAVWIIKWAARYGAWPVLKWLLRKHGGKIAGGAAAAYYIDQGWDWVVETIGAEYAQMLIDNKFEIGAAVALVLGAVALKKYMERQGDKLVNANESLSESLIENTAGAVAAVIQPMGMKPIKRNPNGTVPNALDTDTAVLSGGVSSKRKTKKKNR